MSLYPLEPQLSVLGNRSGAFVLYLPQGSTCAFYGAFFFFFKPHCDYLSYCDVPYYKMLCIGRVTDALVRKVIYRVKYYIQHAYTVLVFLIMHKKYVFFKKQTWDLYQ